EPREGGRWYGLSEAGVEDIWGEVLVWEPPSRLVLAWRINGQFKCDPTVHTEVEVRFADAGDGTTRVELEHRRLENLGVGGAEAIQGMDGGWGLILARFKDVLEA
ncbi:MAG TPA: SRPBCC domain-containing protein, partial [Phenylobacterium sp.]|nr:SRPBCC domain-containing protein [Phenylobacterium sp.]